MNRTDFTQLIPQLRPVMVRVGRNFFGNNDDAEDVAQDALVRLWHYCERLDPERNLETLAVMVAKNVCIEHYKKRQQMPRTEVVEMTAQQSFDADAPLRAQETQGRIDRAIESLSPREQVLVRARHLDDKSATVIAAETGIPKMSVRSMLSMAKAKLKRKLRQ